MALSGLEEKEMYTKVVETARDITWLRERLEDGDTRMDNCDKRMDRSSKRLGILEAEQKLLKGKLGFFVLALSAIFTGALHAIGWVVAVLGGKYI